MSNSNLLKLVLCLFVFGSCMNRTSEEDKWQSLFNGEDLTGWDTYLGPKYDTILKKRDTIPIGLNIDPARVFTVVELDGEKVLRISGENWGGISTINEFENYHLQLQFRWGDLKWAPRLTAKRDGGLMYYGVGAQGTDGGYWLRSQEFQIQEGDCGDLYPCAGAIIDIMAVNNDGLYLYNEDGQMYTFTRKKSFASRCIKNPDAEKPNGEWNTIDLYCFGGSSIHMLNDVVVMRLHNSRQYENDTVIVPLTKGKIQLQSESAEMFYRNIRISKIDKLPDNLLFSKNTEQNE